MVDYTWEIYMPTKKQSQPDWALGDLADYADDVVFAYGEIAMKGWGGKEKNNIAKLHTKKVFDVMKAKKGTVYAFNLTKKNYPQHPLWIKDLNTIPWKELTSA